LAGSLDPTTPVEIALPFATTVNNGESTLGTDDSNVPAPYDNCAADDQSIWYTFNSGTSTSVDFFAIGEDTEIQIAEMPGVANCQGGDGDADPTFESLGLTPPAGFEWIDTDSSELWEDIPVTPDTTYILSLGHNSDDNRADCIAWGIKDSADTYPDWEEDIVATSCPTPPLPDLSRGGIYGIDDDGKLWAYGFASNSWGLVGATDIDDGNDIGVAFSESLGLLLAVTEDGELYSVDPNDATTVLIGNTGLSGDIGAAVISDTLYVSVDTSDSLYSVDVGTASATLLGTAADTDIEALAPSKAGSFLYATDTNSGQGQLLLDGSSFSALTNGGSLPGERGLAYDPVGGLLYGSDNDSFGSLDPATGVETELADFLGDDLEGIAFVSAKWIYRGGDVPVPTLPFFGLLALTSLLGLFGLRKLTK
jgi:hypothetical protein